jgi:hypothetical protein
MSLEGTATNLRRVLRSLLRDRKHSPIHDWLVVSTVDGHIAARAPGGECFRIAIVPIPPESADAQALAEVAGMFEDLLRRPRRAQR